MKSYSIYPKRDVYYIQWYDHTGKKNAKSLNTKDSGIAQLKAIQFFEQTVKGSSLDYIHIIWDQYAHAIGLSKRTRKDGREAMEGFIEYFEKTEGNPHKSAKDITQEELIGFLVYMNQDKGYGVTTISIRLRSLKSIFNFAFKRKMIDNKPFDGFKIPKAKNRQFCLEISEIKRLLSEAMINPLHFGWIELILLTGCRAGEIRNLKWEDVKQNVIFFNGKTGRRDFPLTEDIHHSLNKIKNHQATNCEYVLSNEKGAWLGKHNWIGVLVKRYMRKAGLNEKYSLHTLRHTFVTQRVARGDSVWLVKELAGHSNVTTTQGYIHKRPGHGEMKYW